MKNTKIIKLFSAILLLAFFLPAPSFASEVGKGADTTVVSGASLPLPANSTTYAEVRSSPTWTGSHVFTAGVLMSTTVFASRFQVGTALGDLPPAVTFAVISNNDHMVIIDGDSPADERCWIWKADASMFEMITANDAFNSFSAAWQISRIGVIVEDFTVPNANLGVGMTAGTDAVPARLTVFSAAGSNALQFRLSTGTRQLIEATGSSIAIHSPLRLDSYIEFPDKTQLHSGKVTNSNAYGCLFWVNLTSTILINDAGTFYQVTSTVGQIGLEVGIDVSTENTNITISTTGVYNVSLNISFSATANSTFETALFVDDVEQNRLVMRRKIAGGGDTGAASATANFLLSSGQVLDVRTKSNSASDTVIVEAFNLNVQLISE